MSKDNVLSKVKTAGAVATAIVTLNACEQKPVTEDAVQRIIHKTDSAANVSPEYQTTTNAINFYEARLKMYRNANKSMLKYYAKDYITKKIKDVRLCNFLAESMENQMMIDITDLDMDTPDGIIGDFDVCNINRLRLFRRNQRWFNDLVLYLSDRCDEQQFLSGPFFETIKNTKLKKAFEYNAKQMDQLNSVVASASKRRSVIYEDLWNKYLNEEKTRKR